MGKNYQWAKVNAFMFFGKQLQYSIGGFLPALPPAPPKPVQQASTP